MSTKPTLIFDLDNTIVECGQYYLNAQEQLVTAQNERTGVDPAVIKAIFGAIDLHSTKLPGGFSRNRYPRSFQAAAAVLDIIRGERIDHGEGFRMWKIGDAVFSAPYTPYDGAIGTLETYQRGGWNLILCSKGEDSVQQRKIDINGLQRFFAPQRTYITLVKSVELLQRIVAEQEIDTEQSWYVGDSMKDDIGPALAVGMKAVEVRTGTGKWAYEDVAHPPTATVSTLRELLNVIPVLAPEDRKALVAA